MSHIIDAKLAVTLDKNTLKQTINHLQNQVSGAKIGNNVYAPVVAGAKQYRNELSYLNSGIEQQSRRYAILARTISTLSGQFIGLYSAYRMVGQGVAAFTKYETELTAVRQITSASIYDTKILSQEVRNLGIQYGVASDAIMGTSIELLQAGQSMKEVKALVPILAQLAKNSQVGSEGLREIARATTAWREVFKGTTNDEMGLALGKSVQLSKAGLVEVNDLIEASSILGKVWADNGGSLSEMLATITAIKQGSGRPASEGARGLNTILQRLMRKDTRERLEGYGIQLFDDNKQFRGAIPVITDIAALRKRLGESTKATMELDTALTGTFRASIGKTLYDNVDAINKYAASVKNVAGVLEQDAAYAANNLETKLTRLKETAKDSAIQFGNTFGGGILKNMVDTTTQLVKMRTELLALSLIPLSKVFGGWRDKIAGEVIKRKSMFNIYGGIQPRGNKTPFLKNAHRGMMKTGGYGLAGAGMLYGAANVPMTSKTNALGSATLAGLGAGFMSLQMGIHPLVAGFIALGTATTKLSSSLEEFANNQIKMGISEQQVRLDRATTLGLFDKSTMAEAKRSVELLNIKDKRANQRPNPLSVMMTWGSEAKKDDELRKQQRTTFFNESQGSRATIAQYRQAFLESGKPISKFDTWQNGIMKVMEEMDDLTDDLVGRNFSSKLKKSIENELEARRKAAEELANRMVESDVTDEIIEKLQNNVTKTLTKKYADTNSAFSSLYSDLQGQSQIGQGISAFKTKPGRKNLYDTNTDVKNMVYKLRQYTQQAQLGIFGNRTIKNSETGENLQAPNYGLGIPSTMMGGNTINDLEAELSKLTSSLRTGEDRFGATTNAINQTRSALGLLADVSKRTASSFEELNRLTSLQNAQGDFAEWSLTASRSELRDMNRGKELTQSLYSSGQGLETLSRRDREKVLEYTRATGGIDAGISGRDNIMSGLLGTEVRDILLSNSGVGKAIGMDKTMMEQRKEEKKIGDIMTESKKAQDVLLKDSFTQMNNATAALSTAITNSALLMNKAGDKYLEAANAIPSNLTWDGRVQVDLVGGAALLENIEPLIVGIINRSLNGKAQVVDATMPPSINSAKQSMMVPKL